MGFVRRFSNFPGREVLQEIEGVVTIDETPAGDISGVSQGVACLVGEFSDVTFGVAIDANGVVTTRPQPIETFGSQDILDKVGGWDETIGEFGGDGGNGFLELKNRSFSRLVLVPINNAASHGVRLWRKLPTNTSATSPSPVVTLSGATVVAGREFKSGNNRVRLAQRIQFSSTAEFKAATDGAVTLAGAPAATQTLTSASGGFTTVLRPDGTRGVQVGDAVVLGVIGGAGALGANADTYRVQAVTSDTVLTLEKQSGATFDWTTGTAQPYRIHAAEVADTGSIAAIASATGFRVPVRPLDASIAASTNLTPTIVPPALTATSADPLSGLAMRTDGTTGVVFVSNVHTPNVGSNADLDALYALAIDSLIDDDLPEREVNILWSARSSSNIDVKGTTHVLEAKANGVGRMWIFSPPLDTTAIATATGDSAPGSGANRAREGIYTWPGARMFVNEAVGTLVKGADQLLYKTGELDIPAGGCAASILSKLAPERNPGQASDPVKTIMAPIIGIQRGVTGLGINQYKQLKAKGVMALRNDRDNGMIFQSGVTRSLIAGEKEIYVRRFSFFVEDSIASALAPYVKELMTEALKDQVTGLVTDFLDDLLSVGNKSAARIKGYALDPKSGNTRELAGSGIFVIKYTIEMLDIANTIVQQASVGLGLLEIETLAG
jgi:hypothetical protein